MLGLSFTRIFKHTTSTLHFVLLRNLFSFLCPLVEILRFVHIAYEKKKKQTLLGRVYAQHSITTESKLTPYEMVSLKASC